MKQEDQLMTDAGGQSNDGVGDSETHDIPESDEDDGESQLRIVKDEEPKTFRSSINRNQSLQAMAAKSMETTSEEQLVEGETKTVHVHESIKSEPYFNNI